MSIAAVILAAGKGTRMRSEQAKVIHRVAGRPMVEYVLKAARGADVDKAVIVVGHQKEQVQQLFGGQPELAFAVQEEQLGTGHALMMAEEALNGHEEILVLAGDTPLLKAAMLKEFIDYHRACGAAATVLTTEFEDPYGYGRIVRSPGGDLEKIIEEKDANPREKLIKEINSGIYCFNSALAFEALKSVNSHNAQGEYYLTDVLSILRAKGYRVEAFKADAAEDIQGINDRIQLAEAAGVLRSRKNRELMESGVSIIDPGSTFIDSNVSIGRDTIVYPFTIIEGQTTIGIACEIGPYVRINDADIGDGVEIENSRIKEAVIGDQCTIGPFAYLRPGTVLAARVKVGDFTEVKKSYVGEGSKIPHLSYIGDATIGRNVNVGAGTITCNYDGQNKYETFIEDGAFIGSNTNLVAPVKIGAGATTGAGSSITRDVPAGALGVERAAQKNLERWASRKKQAD